MMPYWVNKRTVEVSMYVTDSKVAQ